MRHATSVLQRAEAAADTITLDSQSRHRRRIRLTSDGGVAFLLDLPEARLLRHGEGVLLDDGRVIEVRAAPETLYEVRGRDGRHLLALAWHIGNRHLAAQIEPARLLVQKDPVIGDMLRGLGAMVREVSEPFDPEPGAYHKHSHAHGPDSHGHSHHSHTESEPG